MYIADFCNTENCTKIEMQDECVLIFNDKIIFSYLNKEDKIDLQTFPRMYKIGNFVSLILLGIFSIAPWYLAMKHQYDYTFYLFLVMTTGIFVVWLYRVFCMSCTTKIQLLQEKIKLLSLPLLPYTKKAKEQER
ncbi:MAG: hypothetical protein LBU22_01090 [Dysgonamonadaceae bacterium]|jgi:hypothetical protein|nr:hypothetical protein [Dysgonamonadaceae bacterium]